MAINCSSEEFFICEKGELHKNRCNFSTGLFKKRRDEKGLNGFVMLLASDNRHHRLTCIISNG